jgi:nucleotide-binding universal stress UspA family protein
MKFDKILIPLDGSRFAEAALPKAMELVSTNPDATLILLRAAEARTFPGVDPIDAQLSVVHEAEDYLETMAARLRKDGGSAVRTSVWYGAAATAILEAARMENPDLIMMSTHGRSGTGRLIAGSVAESVLRGTRTPIFLVRVDDRPVETSVGRATAHERATTHVLARRHHHLAHPICPVCRGTAHTSHRWN